MRIYAGGSLRGDAAHDVDAALLRLVRGLVPVPEVLEVRRADPGAGLPALLVTSFLPGVRADLLIPDLDDRGLAVLGRATRPAPRRPGRDAACCGPDRSWTETWRSARSPSQARTSTGFPPSSPHTRPRSAHWRGTSWTGCASWPWTRQALLDTVGRSCLVHSDVNPKNLLVDPDSLEVTGLLDWEFAHAGHPYADLGNLLRFDRLPAFVETVLDGYVARHGGQPAEALELARAADLWALVDLAARRGQNPVADRAHDLLLAIVDSGDLHAAVPRQP